MPRKPAASVKRSKTTNSKGNQQKLKSPQFSVNYPRLKTSRQYGPGMVISRKHD